MEELAMREREIPAIQLEELLVEEAMELIGVAINYK